MHSQELRFQRANELNPRHNLAHEPLVVSQKQIGAGLGGGGKVDGIRWGHT
jgi:hypothetical protein